MSLGLLSGAMAALVALLVLERTTPTLRRGFVWILVALVLVVAVASPSRRSRDLWQYTMYGRMVAVHHASPYAHGPADFPHDPAYRWVDPIWRHTPSLYGPGFTELSAEASKVLGLSRLATRLFYQGMAALAILLAAVVIDRRTRDPMAVLLFVVNPAIGYWMVNGGHNDALVALAAVAAVLAAERRRPALTGVAVGLAALVKVTALLALVPLCVWFWFRTSPDRRSALLARLRDPFVAAATGLAVTAVGFVAWGGGAAVQALHNASKGTSWPSMWRPVASLLAGHSTKELPGWAGTLGLGVVGGVVALWAWAGRNDESPARGVAAGLLAFFVAAPYTIVWYVGWAFALLCLRWRSRLTTVALVVCFVEVVAAEQPRGAKAGFTKHFLDLTTGLLWVVEAAAVGYLAWLAWRSIRPSRGVEPPPEAHDVQVLEPV